MLFIFRQKINFILHNFLELFFCCEDIVTCFGYFGHAWLYTPKEILSIYRKLSCLSSANKKIGCQQQEPEPELKNQNFAKYGIGAEISTTILAFILDYFQEKRFRFLINFLKSSKKILVKNGQK